MVCAEANHCFDSVSWVTYEEFDPAPEYAILKGYVVKKIRSTNLRMHGRDTAVIYKNGAPRHITTGKCATTVSTTLA